MNINILNFKRSSKILISNYGDKKINITVLLNLGKRWKLEQNYESLQIVVLECNNQLGVKC